MSIEISAASGSTAVNLQINTSLDAAGLEDLIRQLAFARAAMQPPVPMDIEDMIGGSAASLVQDATSLAAEPPKSDGQVTLRLRSEGLGWVGWRLHPDHSRALRDFFNGYFPQAGDGEADTTNKKTH